MACFVKAENLTPHVKMEMDFRDKMLPLSELYVSPVAENLTRLVNVLRSPIHPQQYTCIKKLPLKSRTLQSLSACNPLVRGHCHQWVDWHTAEVVARDNGPLGANLV